jgi:hypothetical protein
MGKKRTWATPEELAKQRMNELTDMKQAEFNKYKAAAPGIQQQQVNDARRGFAQSLQQGVGNLNRGANASGMLFSGRRAAGEAGLRGQAAGGYLAEKDAIGNRMRNYLDSSQTDLTNQRYGIMTNNAQEALASAQAGAAKAMAQQEQIKGIMNAGGQMAGGIADKQSQPKQANLGGPQSTVVGGNNYSGSYTNRPQRNSLWNTGGNYGGNMVA